jgi:hypothetical protein
MELSKEQIQYIDNRLENEGIKYWDIRIEMLDHIVSVVEKNLQLENTAYQFRELVQDAFVALGWKENFNGGGFEEKNKQGWKNANKYYRKIYFAGFVDFFKKTSNLLVLSIFLFAYFSISEMLTHKIFLKLSYILFFSPFILFVFTFYKMYKKKYGKSVHRDYGLSYLMLSFLMLNAIITFVRIDGGFPIEFHKIILFIIIPTHFIFTYSGYKVYKKAISKVEKMHKELRS